MSIADALFSDDDHDRDRDCSQNGSWDHNSDSDKPDNRKPVEQQQLVPEHNSRSLVQVLRKLVQELHTQVRVLHRPAAELLRC